MGKEIERKFLINVLKWNELDKPAGKTYRQGYMLTDPHKTIRVRLAGNAAFLTIKGINVGATRTEYEYEIPAKDAAEMLDIFCDAVVEKKRFGIMYAGKLWEVDVFEGNNEGLIVAEIELMDEAEAFAIPGWIGKEVTGEKRYYNSNLSEQPFCNWKNEP